MFAFPVRTAAATITALLSCPPVGHAAASSLEAERVPEVLGSSPTYQAMSLKVNAMEAQIQQAQLDNSQALAKKRVEYNARIQHMREDNLAIAMQSRAIARNITRLKEVNAKLRKEAEILEADHDQWQGDWLAMKSNLTTAMEVTQRTLGPLKAQEPPELAVLTELDKQEAVHWAETAHFERLAEIAPLVLDQAQDAAPVKFSYLQMGRAAVKKSLSNPVSVIKMLEDGFTELAEDNRKKQKEMYASFMGEARNQEAQQKDLVAEQITLNATLADATDLNSRLVVAVEALEKMNRGLEQRGLSIRSYAQQLGSRAMPANGAPETSTTTSSAFELDAEGNFEKMAAVLEQAWEEKLPLPIQKTTNLRALVSAAKEKLHARVSAHGEMAVQSEVVADHAEEVALVKRGTQGLPERAAPGPRVVGGLESQLPSWLQWLR